MKKAISLFLALLLALTMFITPTAAAYAEEKAVNDSNYAYDVDTGDHVVDQMHTAANLVLEIFDLLHQFVELLCRLLDIDCPLCDGEPAEEEPAETYYTVTFDSNGGTEVEAQQVMAGQLAEMPSAPEKDNYLFIGWFLEKNSSDWANPFSFDAPITSDIVLYANYVDMNTDSDDDGLPDELEAYIGTAPNAVDSDGDGLTDYDEKVLFDYNPLSSDTDQNGVTDGNEDHDGDGLTNIEEIQLGINPIIADSDNDGLSDFDEVRVYHTNPMLADTDGDGASDGDEVRLGTDPLTTDTSFTESAAFGEVSESLPVSLSVEAVVDGEQVGTMEITPVNSFSNPVVSAMTAGYLGSAYDISVEGQPDSAVLTFAYDTSLGEIGEEFQPRVYYYNEETKLLEELPNQQVENGMVRVAVEHFSTYILLNKVEFDKVWETEIKPPDAEAEESSLDIVFVVDYSASMDDNDPTMLFKRLAKDFVEKLRDEKDKAGVVKFIRRATLVSALTTDKAAINAAIDSISYDNGYGSYSGTDGSTGMNLALEQLKTSEAEYKYIVFITDGQDNGHTYSYDNLIASASEENVVVYTVGMGNASESVLRKIADGTNGKYYHATTGTEAEDIIDLEVVFDEIESETIDYAKDSNADGISDYYTDLIKQGELVLSNGSKEFMGFDFNYNADGEPSDDYDGDGVKNGNELVVMRSGDKVYLYKRSDPVMMFSDADIYDDGAEYRQGSDPMIPSYLAGVVDYPMDDNNFIYVSVYKNEDKWYNEWARQLWSSVTFNWSHQDEAKNLLGSFFKTFSTEEDIQNETNQIMQEVAQLMGDDLIGQAIKLVDAGIKLPGILDGIKDLPKLVKEIKYWISAGNSAKNLSPSHFTRLKAQIGLYQHWTKFKGISKEDVLGAGLSFAWDETKDLISWVQAYSTLTATQSAFKENQDILSAIKSNDNAKEKFVTRAADEILYLVNDEYNKFQNAQMKDFGLATVENIASFATDLLTNLNPWIFTVNLIVSVLDIITPATAIAEGSYYLYVIDELVLASKDLFKYDSKANGFCNINDNNIRHLELLICARIWGGDFAKNITSKQQFITGTAENRRQYAEAIDINNRTLETYFGIIRNK